MALISSETPLAGVRCLVLDDEMLIALDLQDILEAAGAAVLCAGSAAMALDTLERDPRFDIAVIDVMLTGNVRNSLSVAVALMQRQIPFVFLTGMRAQDMEHTDRFPHVPVVEKPFQTALLLEAIARALAGKRNA